MSPTPNDVVSTIPNYAIYGRGWTFFDVNVSTGQTTFSMNVTCSQSTFR
jgi:hypothetical protein